MDALTRDSVPRQARTRRTRWVGAAAGLLITIAICATIWFLPAVSPGQTDNKSDADTPLPVLTATATTADVPIYLDGLGTVQAFYTVTIKPMVDGPLLSVNVREGQDVRKGDVIAQIDPRTYQAALDSAVAKKAQDEAQLANARLDLARQQKLVSNNYTSAQQADTAKAVVAQDMAIVQQDQAQIDTAKTQLSYTTILAPIDGRAGIRQVDPGNIVHAADATGLVVLTQLQPISVLFTLPQQTLPAVAAAMASGPAQVQAMSQGDAEYLDTGTLTVLDNQVDFTTGTIKLKAQFPNTNLHLWPGGFVRVRLQTEIRHNAITVPPAAIQRGPRGPYVFVITNDIAQRRLVTAGFQDDQTAIVTAGLKPGDKVVIDGASRLSDGSKVSESGS